MIMQHSRVSVDPSILVQNFELLPVVHGLRIVREMRHDVKLTNVVSGISGGIADQTRKDKTNGF